MFLSQFTAITENTNLMKASLFLTTSKQCNQHISMVRIFHESLESAASNKNKIHDENMETPEASPFYPNLEQEIKQLTFLLKQMHSLVKRP